MPDGAGGGGCLMYIGFRLGKMKEVLEMMVVMVVQDECT